MYTFIYFTSLGYKLWHKTNFHIKLQFCEGGTILKSTTEGVRISRTNVQKDNSLENPTSPVEEFPENLWGGGGSQ